VDSVVHSVGPSIPPFGGVALAVSHCYTSDTFSDVCFLLLACLLSMAAFRLVAQRRVRSRFLLRNDLSLSLFGSLWLSLSGIVGCCCEADPTSFSMRSLFFVVCC
jgi:hypothetical protein